MYFLTINLKIRKFSKKLNYKKVDLFFIKIVYHIKDKLLLIDYKL